MALKVLWFAIVFKSLTEQFPPEEGYRVARCYDFKFNDQGMDLNFVKVVTVSTTQCIFSQGTVA